LRNSTKNTSVDADNTRRSLLKAANKEIIFVCPLNNLAQYW
jgi:hypothetical protein